MPGLAHRFLAFHAVVKGTVNIQRHPVLHLIVKNPRTDAITFWQRSWGDA